MGTVLALGIAGWSLRPAPSYEDAIAEARALGLDPAAITPVPDYALGPRIWAVAPAGGSPFRPTPAQIGTVVAREAEIPTIAPGTLSGNDSVALARIVLALQLASDGARREGDLARATALLVRAARLAPGATNGGLAGYRVAIGTASLLGEPGLSRDDLDRLAAIVDGPVFAPPDDRRVLSRAMARELARVEEARRARKSPGWNIQSVRLFGRTIGRRPIRPIPEPASVVLRYVRAARSLPRDRDDFARYRTVWRELVLGSKAEYPRPMLIVPGDRPGHYRGLSLGGFGDEWYAEGVVGREAERRVLAHAIALRRGERPEPPRDPYGSGPLVVRNEGAKRVIVSAMSQARAPDGGPYRPPTRDFSVTIPR